MSDQKEPTAGRLLMPRGYGIATSDVDLARFPWSWAVEHLTVARNYWINTTRDDGRPHAAPVWGLWLDSSVCFATDPTSLKARNMAARPEVVLHLESGDDTVILEGRVERVVDAAALAEFVEAYDVKYGIRVETDDANNGTFRLRPRIALTWREQSFPESATRWLFGE